MTVSRAALVIVALLGARDVWADGRSHLSVGAGGWNEPIHLDLGFWGGVEYWRPGRWGLRADVYGVGAADAWWFEAGASRTLGEARPHLFVALHGGAGYAWPDDALLLAAGLASQFGLKLGPLALGLDGTFHTAITGDRLRFSLTGIVALHATW
jgi:hypothetical protein